MRLDERGKQRVERTAARRTRSTGVAEDSVSTDGSRGQSIVDASPASSFIGARQGRGGLVLDFSIVGSTSLHKQPPKFAPSVVFSCVCTTWSH